jgi:hypothetical protein
MNISEKNFQRRDYFVHPALNPSGRTPCVQKSNPALLVPLRQNSLANLSVKIKAGLGFKGHERTRSARLVLKSKPNAEIRSQIG